jgi:hypothetical protein
VSGGGATSSGRVQPKKGLQRIKLVVRVHTILFAHGQRSLDALARPRSHTRCVDCALGRLRAAAPQEAGRCGAPLHEMAPLTPIHAHARRRMLAQDPLVDARPVYRAHRWRSSTRRGFAGSLCRHCCCCITAAGSRGVGCGAGVGSASGSLGRAVRRCRQMAEQHVRAAAEATAALQAQMAEQQAASAAEAVAVLQAQMAEQQAAAAAKAVAALQAQMAEQHVRAAAEQLPR